MDIVGLSKRFFQQLGNTQSAQATPAAKSEDPAKYPSIDHLSPMGQRVATVALEFDVKHLSISDVIPLQTRLTEVGLIKTDQVRAQGLLTQLAYKHQQAGPMDVEHALTQHLDQMNQQGTVLADYQEGKHLLNTVRNLISARNDQHHAA